jgi:hypothetical protein
MSILLWSLPSDGVLPLLGLRDPPAPASRAAETTGVCAMLLGAFVVNIIVFYFILFFAYLF